jgi:hypothetical protein
MDKETILTYAREILDDTVEPYLWGTDFLKVCIYEAEKEVAIRSRLYQERNSTKYCTIPIVAGKSTYKPNSLVFAIHKLRFNSEPLIRATAESLLDINSKWEDETGTPTHYLIEGYSITLFPIPNITGSLTFRSCRLPENRDTELETPENLQIKMLDYAYSLALRKRDIDTKAIQDANTYLASFDQNFGSAITVTSLIDDTDTLPEISNGSFI